MSNDDNKIMDIILRELLDSGLPFPVPESILTDPIKEAGFSLVDFDRVIEYLVKQEYISAFKDTTTDQNDMPYIYKTYTLRFEGKAFYLSGGFSPNTWKKFVRFLRNDSGYGNAKWIVATIIGLVSLTIAILAYTKK
jgi:hypothetical protein